MVKFVLQSKTTHSLFLSFSFHFRITFLSDLIEHYLDSEDLEPTPSGDEDDEPKYKSFTTIFKNELCKKPYAPTSMIIFLYVHPDSKRFDLSYSLITEYDVEKLILLSFDSA